MQRGLTRETRMIEFLLCVICLLVVLLKHLNYVVRMEIYLVIIGVIGMYMIITFIDLMVVCIRWRIGWSIFSITGALFFFTSAGLSFLIEDALPYVVISAITATVFFFDGLCTLRLNRNINPVVRSYMLSPKYTRTIEPKREYGSSTSQNYVVNDGYHEYERKKIYRNPHREVSSEERQYSQNSKHERNTTDESTSDNENFQRTSPEEGHDCKRRLRKIRTRQSERKVSRKNLQVRRSSRRMQTRREIFKKTVASSYGGTFHMSRDIAPMACPFVNLENVPQNENFEEQVMKKYGRGVQSAVLRNSDDIDLTPLQLPFPPSKYRSCSTPSKKQFDFRSNSAKN